MPDRVVFATPDQTLPTHRSAKVMVIADSLVSSTHSAGSASLCIEIVEYWDADGYAAPG